MSNFGNADLTAIQNIKNAINELDIKIVKVGKAQPVEYLHTDKWDNTQYPALQIRLCESGLGFGVACEDCKTYEEREKEPKECEECTKVCGDDYEHIYLDDKSDSIENQIDKLLKRLNQ